MSLMASRTPSSDTTLGARRVARRDRQIAALSPAGRRLFEIVVDDLGSGEALKLAKALVDALHRKSETPRNSQSPAPPPSDGARDAWRAGQPGRSQ